VTHHPLQRRSRRDALLERRDTKSKFHRRTSSRAAGWRCWIHSAWIVKCAMRAKAMSSILRPHIESNT
jgi:hypothetical protein